MQLQEKAMATHSSTLAWKIPWAEEPGRLQSMGSHRVGHDWSDLAAVAADTLKDWETAIDDKALKKRSDGYSKENHRTKCGLLYSSFISLLITIILWGRLYWLHYFQMRKLTFSSYFSRIGNSKPYSVRSKLTLLKLWPHSRRKTIVSKICLEHLPNPHKKEETLCYSSFLWHQNFLPNL